MAITSTTLSADLSATGLTMTVASGTGFPTSGGTTPQSYLMKIDAEYLYAVLQPTSGVITLRSRGSLGTAAAAHDILSRVLVSSNPGDFEGVPAGSVNEMPPFTPNQQTIGEDVTFTATEVAGWGNRNRVFSITKGSAAAIVLVAPSKAQDGLVVTFTSQTAYLHAITATALLANGDTASPYTTATGTNTKIGATLTLQAQNGLWNVVSNGFFTLS